jgi:hypothetical protein
LAQPAELIGFAVWLMKRGNRESTIERKIRYLEQLNGSPQDMMTQALSKNWTDGVKENALDVVCQFAEFLGVTVKRPNFRAYDNREIYVSNPEMVRRFLYRVRSQKSSKTFNQRWTGRFSIFAHTSSIPQGKSARVNAQTFYFLLSIGDAGMDELAKTHLVYN